jgi:DNA-binding GntR family transcriptional regulator
MGCQYGAELEEKSVTKRPKGSGWKAVYDTLQTEILALRLPPGHLLDETTLAKRFHLSRSPIREALIRLSGDELVITLPNRSTIVAPIEISTFPRYVEALDIAQRVNSRLAAEHRTDADLKIIARRQRDFEAAVKGGNHLLMSETNKKFHMAIADAGRNLYMAGFYERLLSQGRRMLHLHFDYLGKPARGDHAYLLTDEHDDMLAAIQNRDVDRADELAHAHTRQFRDAFVEFLKMNYVTDVSLNKSHQAA